MIILSIGRICRPRIAFTTGSTGRDAVLRARLTAAAVRRRVVELELTVGRDRRRNAARIERRRRRARRAEPVIAQQLAADDPDPRAGAVSKRDVLRPERHVIDEARLDREPIEIRSAVVVEDVVDGGLVATTADVRGVALVDPHRVLIDTDVLELHAERDLEVASAAHDVDAVAGAFCTGSQ